MSEQLSNCIAVVGMTGRFPGARDLAEFWQNLRNGVESVKIFGREELRELGIDEHLLDNPKFVAADAILDGVEMFDAAFFGFSPREAEIMDPQHRLFLESSWELLESAGYCADKYRGRIAVYAGSALSTYLVRNLSSNPQLIHDVGTFKIMLANDKDFLATRVSYKMGLTGPSINVNTLCSSSAVAVHLGCESLLNFQSDMALAGGISLQITRNEGFFYQEGGIGSADGHCRAYDEKASGTVSGSGLGILLLKRLDDALADGDQLLAVIRSCAVNNDGSKKASYTAPNPQGQAECIAEAIELAGIAPETITYVEGHGTGTKLGDPIEVEGLTRAFRTKTSRKQFCHLGSVKTNIGHLVTAGGVASIIKTILCLRNHELAPSLNFDRPNPNIDFANSPFKVCAELTPWHPECGVRRAGVSSLGIGGTNVHVILEEAPVVALSEANNGLQAILLSAKTAAALVAMGDNLAGWLRGHPDANLADLAYTLQIGRKDFAHKRYILAGEVEDLCSKLARADADCAEVHNAPDRPIVFMFPGQGAQYLGMAASWHRDSSTFRSCFDALTAWYHDSNGIDLATPLLDADAAIDLNDTRLAQPALFIVEYALAKALTALGITAQAMIGHSLGEYTAACLNGVCSAEQTLQLIHERARLMATAQPGAMLAIALPEAELAALLPSGLDIAAVNAADATVASGPKALIDELAQMLATRGVHCVQLPTSHAFHSGMMQAAAEQFERVVAACELQPPRGRYLSNVTGTWITAAQATSAAYWKQHMLGAVRFQTGIATLLDEAQWLHVEVGPGRALSGFAQTHRQLQPAHVMQCMPSAKHAPLADRYRVQAIANLWLMGVAIDWSQYHGTRRLRLSLPTYPFERKRYWIEENRYRQLAAGNVALNSHADLQRAEVRGQAFASGGFSLQLHAPLSELGTAQQQVCLEELLALREALQRLCQQHLRDSRITLRTSEVLLSAARRQHSESSDGPTEVLRDNVRTPYQAAKTEVQKILVEHWEQVLGAHPIGILDNFFELGGHSLLAAALATKLRSVFALEIPLQELLGGPTIEQLSQMIETRLWLKSEAAASSTEPLEAQFEYGAL